MSSPYLPPASPRLRHTLPGPCRYCRPWAETGSDEQGACKALVSSTVSLAGRRMPICLLLRLSAIASHALNGARLTLSASVSLVSFVYE